jgi:alanyl-tRNA synthetase
MKAADIRRIFLDFYRARDHRVVASSSLVPDDPEAPLLTTAGMVQFIPYLSGKRVPEFPRATSCQKSARTTDLEEVGLDARHQTFFEMLGNFSFGDYFKSEAIPWAYELVTKEYGLDPGRLWVSVYEEDDEAERIWRDEVGFPAERIVRLGRDENFWWMGVPGPGGPCSEIYYDRGPAYGEATGFEPGDRIMEFYNLVFTEFEVDATGEPVGRLPKSNVDTGMGLERLAAILQDVPGAYETDLFAPLIGKASALAGIPYKASYERDAKTDISIRIIAEHARFAAFLIGDGVFPANVGRGYVLRGVLRRAVRHARLLGISEPVMAPMVEAVVAAMGEAYPDLVSRKEMIVATTSAEEEHFRGTLEKGLTMLETAIAETRTGGAARLSGDAAFKLHDTYGFPLELTVEIARENGLEVDADAFTSLMHEQQERARAGMKRATASGEEALRDVLTERGPTKFLGYERTEAESTIGGIVRNGQLVPAAGEGDEVEVVLDATPFYAEGGGQVGDTGLITADGGVLEVMDTQPALGDLIVHRARVRSGEVKAGADAHAVVDAPRRAAVGRSHTATHVLHATLRQALGPHAHQAGSLVDAGRLRFDFPHNEAVPRDMLAEVEETVVRRILLDDLVRPYETTRDEASAIGATALFGEKYGDIVRVVEIGDYSIELCGGTHVTHTSQIGPVLILGEASIGSGLRRIEALTGTDAIASYRNDRKLLEQIAGLVKGSPEDAAEKVQRILDDLKAVRARLEKAQQGGIAEQAKEIAAKAERAGDASIVAVETPGLDVGGLQKLAVAVRTAIGGPAAVIVGARRDDGANVVAAVSKDLVGRGLTAKALVAAAAPAIDGKGGGKDDLATGGGGKPDGLPDAIKAAEASAKEKLGS